MGAYFNDLPWSFDFSSVHNKIEEIAVSQQIQGSQFNTWCIIPCNLIVKEQPFSKIENAANQYGFSIRQVIYRRQLARSFGIIHTDSFNTGETTPVPVPFSLNIPLENSSGAVTRWYDFSTNPELKDEDTRISILNYEKFQSPTSTHPKVNEFLKYCVAEYTMNSPVVINTTIPHNVDARELIGDRSILSLWFAQIGTRKLVTWDQSKFLEKIIVD